RHSPAIGVLEAEVVHSASISGGGGLLPRGASFFEVAQDPLSVKVENTDTTRGRSIACCRLGAQSGKDFLFSHFWRRVGLGSNRRLIEQYFYDLDGLLRCTRLVLRLLLLHSRPPTSPDRCQRQHGRHQQPNKRAPRCQLRLKSSPLGLCQRFSL